MTQTGIKVTGWTTAYNISGVVLQITVQAKSRDEAVSLLGLAGYDIIAPEAVQQTITIGYKHRALVGSLRGVNVEAEARPTQTRSGIAERSGS